MFELPDGDGERLRDESIAYERERLQEMATDLWMTNPPRTVLKIVNERRSLDIYPEPFTLKTLSELVESYADDMPVLSVRANRHVILRKVENLAAALQEQIVCNERTGEPTDVKILAKLADFMLQAHNIREGLAELAPAAALPATTDPDPEDDPFYSIASVINAFGSSSHGPELAS